MTDKLTLPERIMDARIGLGSDHRGSRDTGWC